MDADTGINPRRWLQFGLRTTLVFMLLVGVILGYWCDRAARLRKTVAAMESLGAQVYWEGEAGPEVMFETIFGSPQIPSGLGGLGPEFFCQPTSVVLARETSFDQAAPHLRSLPKLKAIYFSGDEHAARTAFRGLHGVELFAIRHGRCGDLIVDSLGSGSEYRR